MNKIQTAWMKIKLKLAKANLYRIVRLQRQILKWEKEDKEKEPKPPEEVCKRKCEHCGKEWEFPSSEMFSEKHRYCCGDMPLIWMGGEWK
jgi:hypothetical protein